VGFSWAIALVALTMACAGVFAVVSLVMDERRQEIGIRMALGAGSAAIVRSTLQGTGLPLAAGAAGGLLLALGAGPLLRALLVGVAPLDPIAFGLAAAILGATAVAATIVPLRRALRVNPAVTLRAD
jgi:ABC-type antimicrobial peptide transport system permease subunit